MNDLLRIGIETLVASLDDETIKTLLKLKLQSLRISMLQENEIRGSIR